MRPLSSNQVLPPEVTNVGMPLLLTELAVLISNTMPIKQHVDGISEPITYSWGVPPAVSISTPS